MVSYYVVKLTSVYFVNSTTGFVVGDNGTILKTTNSGERWKNQKSGIEKYFNKIIFIN